MYLLPPQNVFTNSKLKCFDKNGRYISATLKYLNCKTFPTINLIQPSDYYIILSNCNKLSSLFKKKKNSLKNPCLLYLKIWVSIIAVSICKPYANIIVLGF